MESRAGISKVRPIILYSLEGGINPIENLPQSANTATRPRFVSIDSWTHGEMFLADILLIAVVIPMTTGLLENHSYTKFLMACAALATKRENFRLYIFPMGLEFKDIVAKAKQETKLADLVDTIRFPEKDGLESLEEIDSALVDYLDQLEDIQDASMYRTLLRQWCASISLIAFALLLLGFASSIAVIVLNILPAGRDSLAPAMWNVISFGVGISECMVLLTIMSNSRFRLLQIVFGIGIIVGSVFLSLAWIWAVAGALLTFASDYFRRKYIGLVRIPLSFEEAAFKTNQRRLNNTTRLMRILGRRIWPIDRKVFISYARRTWADEPVKRLRHELQARGVNCFLDIRDIELGSCWRHALEDGIRTSTDFLFFDQSDPSLAPRLWHRAELYTASVLEARTGAPSITIITRGEEKVQPISAYRRRLEEITGKRQLHIAPVAPSQIEKLAQNVATMPSPIVEKDSLLGSFIIGFMLRLLWFLLSSVTQIIGSFGFYWGRFLLIPLLIVIFMGTFASTQIGYGAVCSLVWLCVGFGFRASLHERFEAKRDMVRRMFGINAITLIFFILTGLIMGVQLFNQGNNIGIAFAIALLFMGSVSLDWHITMGRRNFIYGMRDTINRV